MRNKYDVIIAGAGPAGTETAYWLKKGGATVLIIEKKCRRREKPCGGAIPVGEIIEFGMPPAHVIERKVKKALIFSSFSKSLEVEVEKEIPGITVRRSKYDSFLQERAGTEIIDNAKILKIEENKKSVKILFEKEGKVWETEGEYFINAGGVLSDIPGILNIPSFKLSSLGITLQYWIKTQEYEKNTIEFFYFPKKLGEGYIWVFPRKDHVVSGIGVSYKSLKEKNISLKKIIKDFLSKRFHKFKIFRKEGGFVPLELRERLRYQRILFVGDAAGLCNIIHGGGIYQARKSGKIAAEAIINQKIKHYEENIREYFEEYERKWDRKLKPFFTDESLFEAFIGYAKKNQNKIKNAISIILGAHKPHKIAYEIIEKESFKMITEELDNLIKDYREIIDKNLSQIFRKENRVFKVAREILLRKGRRLRAVLVLLACEAVGGNIKDAIPVALAYELSHTASLVHDDIIDNGRMRRGDETIHVKYGIATAITVGDALLIKAFNMLSLYRNNHKVEKERIIELIDTGCEGGLRASVGELEDFDFDIELLENTGIKRYLDIAKKKTASLIETATQAGAIIGKGTKEEINFLKLYGRNLGIAFQIYDDTKDLLAPETVTLKSRFSDIREARLTPQLVYAYYKSSSEDRNFITKILKKPNSSEEEITKVIDIYRKTKAFEFSQRLAGIFLKRAKSYLLKIKESKARKILEKITDILGYWTYLGN